MVQNKNLEKIIEGKLRRPIHINYIAFYIFKTSVEETRNILNKYVEKGIVTESKYAKDYYVLKSQK